MRSALLSLLTLALTGGGCFAQTLQEDRWDRAKIAPASLYAVRRIADRIELNRHRYEAVAGPSNVPWYITACIHNMESGGSFHHHLHEGSSLRTRTRYVPKGRPVAGTPPFRWEFSAVDALEYDKMGEVKWNFLDASLYALERFNGTGYLRYHPDVPSPYMHAGNTLEVPGKYIADGKWSTTARSKQIGCVTVLKMLEARSLIDMRKLKRL